MLLKQGTQRGLTVLSLLVSALSAEAGVMGEVSPAPGHHVEFSAAGGVNWYRVPNTQLVISSYETDSNQVKQPSIDGAWKVGLGYYLFDTLLQDKRYFNHLLFEVNVYQSVTTLSGSVWQFELPEFNNYAFKAPVTSTRLMYDFKPTLRTWNQVSSYAILGLGATWNKVSYSETVTGLGVDSASRLSLSSKTRAQMAWDVGAGFNVALTDHLSATAEYIYTFLGHGTATNQSANAANIASAPNYSLQTQSLLLGLSAVF